MTLRTAAVPRARASRLLRAVGFAILLGVPVIVLAFVVRAQTSPVVVFDGRAIEVATGITRRNDTLYSVLLVWQTAFQATWVNLAVSAVCVWAYTRTNLRSRALWAFVTLMVAWFLGLAAKFGVQRARPVVEDAVAHAPGYSFPSGHATNTAAAGLTLVLLVWPLLRTRGRVVLSTTVGAAVVLTALDRVFLGQHFPSDVVAGILLGTAMVGASYLGYIGWNPVQPDKEPPGPPDGPHPGREP